MGPENFSCTAAVDGRDEANIARKHAGDDRGLADVAGVSADDDGRHWFDSMISRARERMAAMNSWRRLKRSYLKRSYVAALMLCLAAIARPSAQRTKEGHIYGHVVDVVGASIAGASVFVGRRVPSEERFALVTHTDREGDFQLLLAQGGYDVVVVSPGFASAAQTVGVLAGRTKKTEWKLRPLDCDFPGVNCDTFQ